VVIHDQHPDHIVTWTLVPASGALSTRISPPSSVTRSRISSSPMPRRSETWPGSKPTPSSPTVMVTRPAAAALAQVVADLEPRGLTLKVYDCYRPERAVAHFARWAQNLGDTKMKAEFYPHVDKSTLFRDGYIASRSGHSRGSTTDLTLARRSDGQALDMGTPFDAFTPLSHHGRTDVSTEAQRNRLLLMGLMTAAGWDFYRNEWWHYQLFDARQYPLISDADLARPMM